MAETVGRGAGRDRAGTPEGTAASDAAGALILAACAIWSLISAAGRETRPEGVLLALLAVAAGFACGRICGTLLPVATAASAALVSLLLALVWRHGMPGATATGDHTPGQTGAAAALLVLAAGAACCAAAGAGRGPLRMSLRLLALGTAAVSLALGSVAGFAAALGVLICSLAAARTRRRLPGLVGLALVAGLFVGTSWAVAEEVLPDGLAVSLEGPLTRNRVDLWQDAARLAEGHPVLGVGPGRFDELSPTAQQSLGSDGKPHSAPWQQAAEQGAVGVVLLGAAFGWLLYALWRSPRSTAVVLTAGAALTALAALASVGNALSFTPVTAGAGLLAGLASARRPIGAGEPCGPDGDEPYGAAEGPEVRPRPGSRRTADAGGRG
ncbi:O-antigen ligase family protein [Streptomyces sp. NPDC087866]|uniref:O-antigen ligase family protein n=1 Tax=unclassified Streptomyces TaxID=2593676 RepID=UPI002256BF55|nr:O-antigen ligase family protein [Streptomyces sp. NBC_01789]MCX4450779.1 O-antigen ligase family protein [Streptomyces sp. NBC_01789]